VVTGCRGCAGSSAEPSNLSICPENRAKQHCAIDQFTEMIVFMFMTVQWQSRLAFQPAKPAIQPRRPGVENYFSSL
jgi:hypothetical protein